MADHDQLHFITLGLCAGVAAALLATGLGSPASALGSAPWRDPAPDQAANVTTTDADLGSTAREVVVVTAGQDGPVVRKLRAATSHEAQELVQELSAQPESTAELNGSMSLPGDPSARKQVSGPSKASLTGSASNGVRAQAAGLLASEQYGSFQWGLDAVQAERAWSITRARGELVAVVDTGVDASHPDLASRVAAAPIDLVLDGSTGDPNGHGTQVAGIIAASLDGRGVAGLANRAGIISVRVLDAEGVGDFATVAAGIIRAVDAGASVINLSLGGPAKSFAVTLAVQYAVDQGVSVVAAGSNQCDYTFFPAGSPGVIGVDMLGEGKDGWWWACGGDWVDLIAPGENILSTVPGGTWEYFTGSSAATAFVSAAAALVRASNPTFGRGRVDEALFSTALDDPAGDGFDQWYGHGLLQAGPATLKAAQSRGGLRAPRVKVAVARSKYGDRLRVDVDPDQGAGSYPFTVQSKDGAGSWTTLPATYRTKGSAETRTIRLGAGTFRVVVAAKFGYRGAKSKTVRLTKPTVVVKARAKSAGDKLFVNVDPNQGTAHWKFQVRERRANRSWRTLPTVYRTRGAAEIRTLDLGAGTYRVVVAARHGFRGATSPSVRLAK